MSKSAAVFLSALLLAGSTAFAQEAVSRHRAPEMTRAGVRAEEPTPRHLFNLETSYVFGSDVRNGVNFGSQTAWQGVAEYSHRFQISGHWHLRMGVSYYRYEFGRTPAPVPQLLQSLSGMISIEYVVGPDVGAFLQIWPGWYTENEFDGSAFDVPMTLARAWVLQEDRVYLITGVNAAFLRGVYPVLPIVGLVWRMHEQWTLMGVLPDPRLIYSPSDALSLWMGGQFVGGSFRTDEDPGIAPRLLSHAAVDYTEYRVGAGFDFNLNKISITVGGGWAVQRRFNFERARIDYKTEGAPYLRAVFKAEF